MPGCILIRYRRAAQARQRAWKICQAWSADVKVAMKRRLNSAKIEAKVSGSLSGVSGGMSIISAHNVCHTLCIGVVAALTFFGIAVSGMPLMFLQKYTLLFWGMAVSFLALSLALYYFKGPCISKKAMLFNSGLIVAGVPFS